MVTLRSACCLKRRDTYVVQVVTDEHGEIEIGCPHCVFYDVQEIFGNTGDDQVPGRAPMDTVEIEYSESRPLPSAAER